MKLFSIHGREISYNPSKINYKKFKSKIEEETYKVLKEIFPYDTIIYEFKIPGAKKCSIDFFIPERMIAIECQGKQHYKYVKFFHGNLANYISQKYRDYNKKLFCEINDITLIEIKNVKKLREKLRKYI